MPSPSGVTATRASFADLVRYFLYLGAFGFGGPVALAGFMHRDLVETRRWIDEEEYRLALALAQIMPGPLAAQLAIALGYFQRGIVGATAVGLAFVIPSFLMVVAISIAYRRYGGLWWMQALFYGIGASVIAIITIAAYKLSRTTNRRDPLLWAIFAVLVVVTVWAQAELAEFFVLAGFIVLFARTRPGRRQAVAAGLGGLVCVGLIWLTEHQFLDAVAVAMITPGPVVITVVFIGYLVAGLLGAVMAAIGIFLPVYLFTIVPAPWFRRNRDNAGLKAFVQGATAAATGALAGAVIVLASRAIYDVPTAAIALASLAVLWRFKIPEPLLVAAAGAIGLVVWPLMRGGS